MEGSQMAAYSPVTTTITADGENGVAQDGVRHKGGAGAANRRTLIVVAIVVLVILTIIIIAVAVAVTKRSAESSSPAVTLNTTMATPTSMKGTTRMTTKMTTTPTPMTTTLGPPGHFTGRIVLDQTYQNAYDDNLSPEYTDLMNGFIAAMDRHFSQPRYQPFYSGTAVEYFLSNTLDGTRSPPVTEVNFRTTVHHIGKGLPESLNNTTPLMPYTILRTQISPEQTGA
ncbi:uncharacterized protein [Diadema setosum]|uniref:uncharacterized protein n=1 Tax=Diadema setosum TaxID=31175 RepID=UPI003B3A178E